jgi:hypothetical protein
MKLILASSTLLLLAACASVNDAGWTGSGAEPFDGALAACQSQANGDEAALEACMASKGWTRPA